MARIIAQTADTVPFQGALAQGGECPLAAKSGHPERRAAMYWWTAGLALPALLAWAAWDVGRPGRASAPALLTMRAVGGLGLMTLAALALDAGARHGALVAAAGALALLGGLLGRLRQPAEERRRVEAPAPAVRPTTAPARPRPASPAARSLSRAGQL
jgi:hypothetical protein